MSDNGNELIGYVIEFEHERCRMASGADCAGGDNAYLSVSTMGFAWNMGGRMGIARGVRCAPDNQDGFGTTEVICSAVAPTYDLVYPHGSHGFAGVPRDVYLTFLSDGDGLNTATIYSIRPIYFGVPVVPTPTSTPTATATSTPLPTFTPTPDFTQTYRGTPYCPTSTSAFPIYDLNSTSTPTPYNYFLNTATPTPSATPTYFVERAPYITPFSTYQPFTGLPTAQPSSGCANYDTAGGEDYPTLFEFSGFNVVSESCTSFFPAFDYSLPATLVSPAIPFSSDGVTLCIRYFSFPVITVVGVTIPADVVLLGFLISVVALVMWL